MTGPKHNDGYNEDDGQYYHLVETLFVQQKFPKPDTLWFNALLL